MRFVFLIMVSLGFLAAGCTAQRLDSDKSDGDSVTVTGRVLEIRDGRAADGPVDLVVRTDFGEEILRIPSLFGHVTDQVHELHRVFESVKVGSEVRGIGQRTADGVVLATLQVVG
jgi:hypothetical protein